MNLIKFTLDQAVMGTTLVCFDKPRADGKAMFFSQEVYSIAWWYWTSIPKAN